MLVSDTVTSPEMVPLSTWVRKSEYVICWVLADPRSLLAISRPSTTSAMRIIGFIRGRGDPPPDGALGLGQRDFFSLLSVSGIVHPSSHRLCVMAASARDSLVMVRRYGGTHGDGTGPANGGIGGSAHGRGGRAGGLRGAHDGLVLVPVPTDRCRRGDREHRPRPDRVLLHRRAAAHGVAAHR